MSFHSEGMTHYGNCGVIYIQKVVFYEMGVIYNPQLVLLIINGNNKFLLYASKHFLELRKYESVPILFPKV